MKWRKITKEEQATIIKAKVINPELSIRDISDSTWIAKSTVANTINNTPEIIESLDSTDKAIKIIETMSWIIDDIAEITRFSIEAYKTKAREETLGINDLKGLNEIAKNNFDRKQLIEGKATVNVNVLSDVLRDIQWLE